MVPRDRMLAGSGNSGKRPVRAPSGVWKGRVSGFPELEVERLRPAERPSLRRRLRRWPGCGEATSSSASSSELLFERECQNGRPWRRPSGGLADGSFGSWRREGSRATSWPPRLVCRGKGFGSDSLRGVAEEVWNAARKHRGPDARSDSLRGVVKGVRNAVWKSHRLGSVVRRGRVTPARVPRERRSKRLSSEGCGRRRKRSAEASRPDAGSGLLRELTEGVRSAVWES